MRRVVSTEVRGTLVAATACPSDHTVAYVANNKAGTTQAVPAPARCEPDTKAPATAQPETTREAEQSGDRVRAGPTFSAWGSPTPTPIATARSPYANLTPGLPPLGPTPNDVQHDKRRAAGQRGPASSCHIGVPSRPTMNITPRPMPLTATSADGHPAFASSRFDAAELLRNVSIRRIPPSGLVGADMTPPCLAIQRDDLASARL